MADYKIELGVKLKTDDIVSQINQAESKIDPIKIKIDAETKELTDSIKDALKSLSKGTKNMLTLDTSGIESSLTEVKNVITDIRTALGSIDNSKGITSLVSSVSQISKVLETASNKVESLSSELTALSKKDFSFNIGIDMNKKNLSTVGYGRVARKQVIPQLEEQIKELESLYGGQQAAISKLSRNNKKVDFDIFKDFNDFNSDSAIKKMEAMEKYINSLKKLANIEGIDLSGFEAKFSKTASEMINDITGVEDAVDRAEDSMKKIKNLFGGSVDGENLSIQLDSVVADLKEIKTAIQGLSSSTSIDGLTQSFNRLSEVLDKLDSNFDRIKDSLGKELAQSVSGDSVIKTAQQTGQKIGETIEKSVKQSLNLDDVIDKEVLSLMKEFGISGDKTSNAFKDIRKAYVNYRNGMKSDSSIGIDDDGFMKLDDDSDDALNFYSSASSIDQVTSAIARNKKVAVETDSAYKDLLKSLDELKRKGTKIHLADEIKQEWGDDYRSKRASLGNAFGVGNKGQDLDEWISEQSWAHLINLDQGIQGIADDFYNAIQIARGKNTFSGDELFKTGLLDRNYVEESITSSMKVVDDFEQQAAQSSTQTTNIIVQNEERKQRAYEDTLAKLKQRRTEIDNEIEDYTGRITDPTKLDPNVDFEQQIQGYQNKIDTLEDERVEIVANIEKIESAFKKNENILNSFKQSLSNIGMGADEIDAVAKRISNLGVQIETLNQKKSTRMINTDDGVVEKEVLDVDISGIDEYGNAIKLTQQYDMATADLIKSIEKVSTVQQKAGTSTNAFVKQQKTAVSNLTNQINQINRAATDQNAPRSIKDSGHLQTLADKYDEITSAIQRMENASSDTFVDEQNNVKRLISEFKSLVAEYKNAENVSSKMKGTDFASGLDIAKNDLEKFKAQAKEFPQITAKVEELDRAIENVGDSASLNKFNDQLRVARSELARIKTEITATNRSEKVGINVSGLESKIADLQRISPEINRFETEINDAKVSIQSLLIDLSKVNTQSDFSVVNAKFNAFAKAAEAAGIAVKETTSETKTDLDRLKELATQMGNLKVEIFKLDEKSNANEIAVLESQLRKLKATYDKMAEQHLDIGSPHITMDNLYDLHEAFEKAENKIAQLNARMADTSAMERQNQVAKETKKSYQELLGLAGKISNLETKIEGFKISGKGDNQISALENELKSLQDTYESVMKTFATNINSSNLDIGDLAKLQATLDSSKTKIEELKAKYADARTELAKKIEINIELGKYDNEISQMDDKFNKLSNASDELRASVEQVKNAYLEMENALKSTGDEVADRERLIQAEENYARALEKTNNLLRIQARTERIDADRLKLDDDIKLFQSDIDNWLTKNSAATKRFGSTMLDLRAKAEGVDRVTLNGLIRQFKLVDKQADKAGLKMLSLGDRIKSKFKEYATYFSVAEIFMEVTQAFRAMFEQVKLIDSAMTELKKVTDETDSTYNAFLTNAATRAKEIGTTIDGLVASTADFARLGYGFEDAQGLAEVANIYAVVGDEIEGVEGATESLISTMAAFKDEASGMSNTDFALSVVDKLNEVANQYSVTSGGLGEALKRSASSMAAGNNSLDETIALITAANTVVQDHDRVGRLCRL